MGSAIQVVINFIMDNCEHKKTTFKPFAHFHIPLYLTSQGDLLLLSPLSSCYTENVPPDPVDVITYIN